MLAELSALGVEGSVVGVNATVDWKEVPLVCCLCATVVGVAVVTLSLVLSPEVTGCLLLLEGALVLGGLADLLSWVLLVVEVGLPPLILSLEPALDVGVDVGDWAVVLDDTVLDSIEESVVAVVIPLDAVDALLVAVVEESVACLVVDETVVLPAGKDNTGVS